MNASYYDILGVRKDATQEQIKQAYKKLALKHHPDKNVDKEAAKIKFRSISEAYAVLNDPEKRKKYDIFGEEGLELEGLNFEQFAEDYALFETFIDEILGFNDFEAMLSSMQGKKSKKKGRGRGKRAKGGEKIDMGSIDKMMGGMMEMMMLQEMMKGNQFDVTDLMGLDPQEIEKLAKEMENADLNGDELWDEDDEDLTEQEYKILKFGQQNVQRTKAGKKKKKTVIRCKLDQEELKEEEILLHFSENHLKEFKQWQIKN